MAINIIEETLSRHTDAEIVELAYNTLLGVQKNYRTALERNAPELLWSNVADIALVSNLLKGLHKKNQERLASRPE